MTLTNETPEGWYWLTQHENGHPERYRSQEIVYVSGPTTFRRKPCRLVRGWCGWSERLDVMVANTNREKLLTPIPKP